MKPPIIISDNPNGQVRFEALTGFRCIAACMVFFYHNRKYWRNSIHPEILRLLNEFHFGVGLFFVLSGFLIAYTYSDKPLSGPKNYYRYILLRILRIMPLYWLILTLFYIDPEYGKFQFSWLTYTLFHGFANRLNLSGISQAWSLNVEMTFYILAPFLCFLQKKHIYLLLGALITLFLGTWVIGFIWLKIDGNPQNFFYPLDFVIEGTFPGRCSEFLFGMLLAQKISNQNATFFDKIPYKTLLGLLFTFLTIYIIGSQEVDIYHHGSDTITGRLIHIFILPIFIALSIYGLIIEKTWISKILSSRVFVLLGNASFAFYLVHISYVSLKLRNIVLLPDRNFILLWLISILLYLIFEKPIYDRCRKLLK